MADVFYKLPADLEQDIEDYAKDVERFLTGELAQGMFKAKRVPRGIYEQRKDGTYMVRVRVAGGALTSEQVCTLAELGRDFGNGRLHITTRQDVQIHDVKIDDTPAIMRRLKDVGLSSKGGGGNTVRNVVACPYAGVCPCESFDVTPFAHAVTEYLIPLVGSYNLPRKYKIAFSGCSADCAIARANDLGFIAHMRNGRPGFIAYAGGGMGAHSRTGDLLEEWVPAKDVIRTAEAIRRLFDRLGDRQNKHRARLRFVFERIEVTAFREQFQRELRNMEQEDIVDCQRPQVIRAPDCITPPGKCIPKRQNGVRVLPQHQDSLLSVPLHLPLGFVSSEDFQTLGRLSKEFSFEDGLRTTRSQNVILRSVREGDLPALVDALKQLSIDVLSPSPLERFVACAGASTCRLGLCLSRNAAEACAKAIGEASIDVEAFQALDINISGCPNACGHHPVATIGLFGAAQRAKNRLVPSYHVVLGARHGQENMRLAEVAGTVPARSLPEFLVDLVKDFQSGRTGNENFADYFDRRGMAYFQELIGRHTQIPPHSENPDFYRDWGMDEDFSLAGRGAGECGAGIFEVIRDDITAARKALAPFGILLPTLRALLITRGVDSQDHGEIIQAFEKHFIDTGLVGTEFRSLISCARGYLEGWREAFEGREEDIHRLLDRVELLFSTLDANLNFHPPEAQEPRDVKEKIGTKGKLQAEADLDLRGVQCPMNFVRAKLRLETMEIGDTLTIVLDEGEPVQNVPASFHDEGQEVVEITDLGDGHWRVVVRRKR